METSWQNTTEFRELRGLVERIKRGNCVLVLGPRVAIRANDPNRLPLDELLARDLLASIGARGGVSLPSPVTLRRAADLYYSQRQDREDLELAVRDFYEREAGSTTDFHRDLARLPFRLCISASPDSLMLTAFEEAKKSPQKGYYSFKPATDARLSSPTPDRPLVYYLYGHHEDPRSLVLTEGDLIEFLVAVVRGVPPIPDQVRSILADRDSSFLFLGFGFHNWYLRVLLHVMDVYDRRSKAIAFEDALFFSHPERELVVEFFSGDRLIDFRPFRAEVFAQHLREAYEASVPRTPPEVTSIRESPSPTAPRAFLSYASEDRIAVEALAEELEARGIRVWQDKQDLRAGDDWNWVLLDVIARRVDYVIVVQTPAMTTAIRGVFHREIEAALQRQAEMGEVEGQKLRFLVPVKIGAGATLSSLRSLHAIDVSGPDGVYSLVKSILEDWGRRAAFKPRPQEVV
jgi:nucleotide-binding universal stress UspA family protein